MVLMLLAAAALALGVDSPRLRAADAPLTSPASGSEPGLSLTFSSLAKDAGPPRFADVRVARLPALYVSKDQSPSAFTPSGPFRAIFEGDINMRLRDFVVFSAIGRGKLTVLIGDKAALEVTGDFAGKTGERVRLGKGKNHIIATYDSPPDGDAQLRLLWSFRNVLPEPLSPMVLTHFPTPALDESLRIRQGRFVIATFRCAKCHAAGTMAATTEPAMPELTMDAPSFDEIGVRLSRDWMAAWIENPRPVRPGSHMPRLFSDDDAGHARARDAAEYLGSLGHKAAAPNEQTTPALVLSGGAAYANLNCVACHTLPGAPPDPGRVSLSHAKAKFLPGQLRQFLLKPQLHYAWNPMPDFRLSETEATALAEYLESFDGVKVPAAAGDAGRGKEVVRSSGCLACHQLAEQKSFAPPVPALSAIKEIQWKRGCMAANPADRGTAPDFALLEEQRAELRSFAASGASVDRDAPAEFAQRQVASMRCNACHARDGVPSLLASSLENELNDLKAKYVAELGVGETFAPDQRAPMLTWAGEKLRPQWMALFIGGQIPYKPRPYLHARMPAFAARAPMLAAGLASESGCAPELPPVERSDPALAAIGRTLIGKTPNHSFSCVQCHAVANQPPLAPFEAPAPNFDHVAERLRRDYYFRWVHDPIRLDVETKMPRFDDDDGKTGVTDVLGGDAHQQFNAIWQFILEGNTMRPPPQ